MTEPRWFVYTAEEMMHLKRSCGYLRVLRGWSRERMGAALRGVDDEISDQIESGGMLWGEELP